MSAPATVWTREKQAHLVELAECGVSSSRAARILHVTRNAVLGRAHRTGVHFKSPKPERKPRPVPALAGTRMSYTEDVIAEARRLYLSGLTYAAISEKTGVNPHSLPMYLKGLPRRRTTTRTSKRKPLSLKIEAMAAHYCGLSYAKVATQFPVSIAAMCHFWSKDPEVTVPAREIANRVIAEMTAKREALRLSAAWHLYEKKQAQAAHNAPLLQLLKPRHREICEAYLSGKSLESVGKQFGITRERVRQIATLNKDKFGLDFGGRLGGHYKGYAPVEVDRRLAENMSPARKQELSDTMRRIATSRFAKTNGAGPA